MSCKLYPLALTVGCVLTTGFPATASASVMMDATLDADAAVRSGAQANSNLGTNNDLYLGESGDKQRGYFRFTLPTFNGPDLTDVTLSF